MSTPANTSAPAPAPTPSPLDVNTLLAIEERLRVAGNCDRAVRLVREMREAVS